MTKGNRETASSATRDKRQRSASPPKPAADNKSGNGGRPAAGEQQPGLQQPRVVSRPEDVAGLVLMQIDLVNARKDDLTIAIKGLSDLTRQLVRAYGENTQMIQDLQKKVAKLSSGNSGDKSDSGKQK